MPTNKDVQDFYELRAGLQGMNDFAGAALRLLDKHGIALTGLKKPRKTNGTANGNGHEKGPRAMNALRAEAKAHFTKRRGPRGTPTDAPEPDGQHLTFQEAAKLLKVSDATIRNMTKDGRLPKPTHELRPMKGRPDVAPRATMVLPKAVVQEAKRIADEAE